MKQLFTLLISVISLGAFAQNEVKITEEMYGYSVGSKNSIIVTVPYGTVDGVEKQLKSEMKSWGGKYSESKGEHKTLQSAVKKLFEGKTFDSYARVFTAGNEVKVAVAIDLGGAFLNSAEHSMQFNEMKERLYQFAVTAGKETVKGDLKAEEKILSTMEKEQKKLEKEKESLTKGIEDYKKKITENEKKIAENTALQNKRKEEIATQSLKIKDIEKTKIK